MTPSPSPFMRLHEVVERVRLSRWTLWRLVSEGLFPPPVRASRGRVYYLAADIERWIATRRPDPGIIVPPRRPADPRSATPTSPARARKPTPSVHELLLRSGRPPHFPRQAAAAATRRRLFEPAAPTPAAPPSHAAGRKGLAE